MPTNLNKIIVVFSPKGEQSIQKSFGIQRVREKKQAEIVKNIINEEIKNVSSTEYKNKYTNDQVNISTHQKKTKNRHKK